MIARLLFEKRCRRFQFVCRGSAPIAQLEGAVDLFPWLRRCLAFAQHATGERLRPFEDQIVVQQIQRLRRSDGVLPRVPGFEGVGVSNSCSIG